MSKNVIVGIFGGGQLGMMLCEAAKKLKVRTHIFCPDANAPAQFHSDFLMKKRACTEILVSDVQLM